MNTDYKTQCLDHNSPAVTEGRGKNIIPDTKREPLWRGFLRKFQDPLIVVLLVVFFLSLAISSYEIEVAGKTWSTLIEPAGVLVALLLATGVGFLFEVRAEREFRMLNQRKDERPVKVLRWTGDSRPRILQIKKCDVVLGDVVKLESGDEVPADGHLLRAQSLHIDESAFTGEMYTTKSVATDADQPTDTAYPRDFLLRSSTVIEGNCLYRVSAIGPDTEEGRGARILNEEQTVRTPLNRQLDHLSSWITRASYIVATLIVVGRMAYYFFFDGNVANNLDTLEVFEFLLDSILIAVTLIVVAVPEGLPLSVTLSLALSMRKMLRENNLVRKLHACETMGATTVICTDKTGTLTMNKLEVTESLLFGDRGQLVRGIAVNSTADLSRADDGTLETVGNPTEGALLRWIAREDHADYRLLREENPVVEQVPFTTETKYMTTIATDAEGRRWKYVKGAPEIVLAQCDGIAGGHTADELKQALTRAQGIGRRTLGFACQQLDDDHPTPLLFTGFVGMADPVRSDVREAIDTCRTAGVRVIMVTGDVALTANEIARESGIMTADEPVQEITGETFSAMSDEALKRDVLPTLKVLSRARPTDKVRLVSLLQDLGQVVAVTGDGTNDALALKKAQVGLSMGDGTSRAKEASDITIIDNSFASINKAIMWGRSLYKNIKRFLLFQMTINICACLIVLAGAFIGLDSPLNVTQMLWVNLIMDTFAAMALSSLPPSKSVMHERPRHPESHILDRAMVHTMVVSGLLFFVFLFGLWQLLWHTNASAATGGAVGLFSGESLQHFLSQILDFHRSKPHMSTYELSLFFTFFVMIQFWNLFNAKYFQTGRSLMADLIAAALRRRSLKKSYSLGFLFIMLVVLLGQVFIVQVAGGMFGVEPLPLRDWCFIILTTSLVLIVPDIYRTISFYLKRRTRLSAIAA